MGQSRVVSLYEGFFSGGARILHTDVMIGLQGRGYEQSALGINSLMVREGGPQLMEQNGSYQRLTAADIAVASLGRKAHGNEIDYTPFTDGELDIAVRQTAAAGVLLTVKEQPLRLVNQMEMDVPVIVGLHRSDPEHQGQSMSDLRLAIEMGRVVRLIATAESAKRAYAAAGIPEDMMDVIRNGTDLDRFRPSPERRAQIRDELVIGAGDPVVTFAARFDTMKGIPLFLDSARMYLDKEPIATVLMCGAGMTADNPEAQQAITRAFAGAYDLTERIRLLGIRHDMESIYAASDVISSTSRFGETYPLCLMEGLACGAVPVATDVGDTSDIVGNGRGILTGRDPAIIAAAWQQAYDARPDFLAAITATREKFNRERMIDAYDSLITQYAQV